MNISFISAIIVAIACVGLALIPILNNTHRVSNRLFFVLGIITGIYTLTNILADRDQVRALLWVRLTFVLATAIVLLMVLFLSNFPAKIVRIKHQFMLVFLSICMGIITLLPSFIPAVILKASSTDVELGPLYPIFIVYALSFIGAGVLLVRRQLRHSRQADKRRIQLVAASMLITGMLLSVTNLILPTLTGNNDLSWLSTYFMLIFIGLSSYAIVRHNLFDIRLVVARTLTYILLLATMAGAYGFVLFGLSTVIFKNEISNLTRASINMVLALTLAFTFQPLRRFFERVTDHVFYRDRYDSQKVLDGIGKVLVAEINLDKLLAEVLELLCSELHIQHGQFFIFNEERIYKVAHFGPLPNKLIVVPELLRLKRITILADEVHGAEVKHILEDHNIRLSRQLRAKDEFIGYLLLGDKLSGDIYSNQDLQLIEILAAELALAIQNAKSYEQITQFNITLQDKVAQATKHLRAANENLKTLDKAKDEFISMASHQLRTPLTTIKGYVSMILEGDTGPITLEQKEFLNYAFNGSQRMVSLISDLLNVSRLAAGRFVIEPTTTDIVAVISDEVRQLQSHAVPKNIKLEFTKPKEFVPPVIIDENKTRQVMMNFIDNALYYTPSGSIKVTIEFTEKTIIFRVKDTGMGVPKEAQKKLFTKFFRADNAQNARPDGTGLGLYLAKRVIEDQGGTILFESIEGKGSMFGFELPKVVIATPLTDYIKKGA